MPLYEEKLICPLAVRFTQDHIRPVFQTGKDLESTIRQMKTKPGCGGYDVIIEAPFDAIEIIRWHKRDTTGSEPDAKHWFTFDNRRLYCLQRAAMALWPKRVGAVVQGLYAATDGYQRKDNSTTAGRAVGIGHSPKLLTDTWDWRSVLAAPAAVEAAAFEIAARDDALATVSELADAPAPPSMLELFFLGGAAIQDKVDAISEALSTTDATSPRSEDVSETLDSLDALSEGFRGVWQSARRGDHYEVVRADGGLVCTHSDGRGGTRRVAVWFDEKRDRVWWGSERSLFAQAAEVRGQGGQLRWYCDDGSRAPQMTWKWIGEADAQPKASKAEGAKQPQQRSARRRGARKAQS